MSQKLLLPMIALFLFALPIPTAQAAGCIFHDNYDIGRGSDVPGYVRFPSSNFVKGGRTAYSDSSCQTPAGFTIHFNNGAAHAGSRSSAMRICQSNNRYVVTNAWEFRSTGIYTCTVGDEPYKGSGGKGGADYQDEGPERPPAPGNLMVHHLPVSSGGSGSIGVTSLSARSQRLVSVHSFQGMISGIQFRRLTNWGVGDPTVIEMGYLDAVDIWSNIGSGYEICFPETGRIVFLDAATSPRTLTFPEFGHHDGWTCATLDRAGTMVLVKAPASVVARTTTPTRRPGTNDSIDSAIALEHCSVTTRVYLRLRKTPWGSILDVIPSGTELQVRSRTKSWVKVTYEETTGWSAAWLTTTEGDCDWTE